MKYALIVTLAILLGGCSSAMDKFNSTLDAVIGGAAGKGADLMNAHCTNTPTEIRRKAATEVNKAAEEKGYPSRVRAGGAFDCDGDGQADL